MVPGRRLLRMSDIVFLPPERERHILRSLQGLAKGIKRQSREIQPYRAHLAPVFETSEESMKGQGQLQAQSCGVFTRQAEFCSIQSRNAAAGEVSGGDISGFFDIESPPGLRSRNQCAATAIFCQALWNLPDPHRRSPWVISKISLLIRHQGQSQLDATQSETVVVNSPTLGRLTICRRLVLDSVT